MKYSKERKYEKSLASAKFEELLNENGFKVIGFKEYQTKTDYLIKKEDLEIEYSTGNISNKKSQGELDYEMFIKYYNVYKKYKEIEKGE